VFLHAHSDFLRSQLCCITQPSRLLRGFASAKNVKVATTLELLMMQHQSRRDCQTQVCNLFDFDGAVPGYQVAGKSGCWLLIAVVANTAGEVSGTSCNVSASAKPQVPCEIPPDA